MHDRLWPHVLSLFRVIVGGLFLCHGCASIFGVLGGSVGSGVAVPVGAWPGWWAALIQLGGGALVVLGLGTRSAALLCSGSMAYAYFSVHQHKSLLPLQNGGELSVMFCWTFLLIAVAGPRTWALDSLVRRQGSAAERSTPPPRPCAAGCRPEPFPRPRLCDPALWGRWVEASRPLLAGA